MSGRMSRIPMLIGMLSNKYSIIHLLSISYVLIQWQWGIALGFGVERQQSPEGATHSRPRVRHGTPLQGWIPFSNATQGDAALCPRLIYLRPFGTASLGESLCRPHWGLRRPLLRSERRRGSGRGGAPKWWAARKCEAPLSPTLSPFVPHGARETDAPLIPTVPVRTFATSAPRRLQPIANY